MQLMIEKVANALTSVDGLKVYHYWRPKLEAPYCIYAEDGESGSLYLNNRKAQQVLTGSIDYFTRTEHDPTVDQIQTALNEVECLGWSLNSVQFEDETNLIHYEWVFTVTGEDGNF